MSALPLQHKRSKWYLEVLLLVAGYFVFGLVRAAVDRGDPAATSNALQVQRLEQILHIAIELPLNQAMLAHPAAIHLTGYFYRLSVLAVPVVLVWLYLTRRPHYSRLRTVLIVMMLLDLLLVWLYPEAPPRFALPGVVDYMATYDILGGAASRVPRPGVNLLAAMPSMHVAWTTWCACAVWSALRQRAPRAAWLAWLFPFLVAVVVLVTGHHYVLDILAGVALVAISIGLTRWATHRSEVRESTQ
ncbi:phosphatase PAP2 family protein [Lentzea tibetensis]|uniref:Phosphatase PAP2 family protein n=1 Tax=Lentzea tibetensis TaxID=2591470 RepID=A0A563ELS3_9PSEU|nr:phosphatase PAP2 family protein [Lentzea tibetensis]TWP47982.1 phosphatase PAP2 family protein [Lentzea tibetensis]